MGDTDYKFWSDQFSKIGEDLWVWDKYCIEATAGFILQGLYGKYEVDYLLLFSGEDIIDGAAISNTMKSVLKGIYNDCLPSAFDDRDRTKIAVQFELKASRRISLGRCLCLLLSHTDLVTINKQRGVPYKAVQKFCSGMASVEHLEHSTLKYHYSDLYLMLIALDNIKHKSDCITLLRMILGSLLLDNNDNTTVIQALHIVTDVECSRSDIARIIVILKDYVYSVVQNSDREVVVSESMEQEYINVLKTVK